MKKFPTEILGHQRSDSEKSDIRYECIHYMFIINFIIYCRKKRKIKHMI